MSDFPDIMRNAQADLAGQIGGQFSPDAWRAILSEARNRFEIRRGEGLRESDAWSEVIREFHRDRYFGYEPTWNIPKGQRPKGRSLGMGFVWMTFSAFVITKIAVVWLGQIYTASDDPRDAYLFFAAIGLVFVNFSFFLWRARHYKD